MSAFRRTLTTIAALLVALGTFIALSSAASAQRAPLPDDTYPAPATQTSSAASQSSVILALVVLAVVALAAALVTTKRRQERHQRTATA